MSTWRSHFPGLSAIETASVEHPWSAIAIAMVIVMVVFLITFLPTFMSKKSKFSNLLYTGPGGALDNQLGSCMSQRDDGPYGGCGAAEPFSSKKNSSEYGHVHGDTPQYSAFTDQMNIRNQTVRSRFLGTREPDSVMYADQDEVDALQQEVNSMTGDDDSGADAVAAEMRVAATAAAGAVAAVAAGQITAAQAPAAAAQAAAPAGAAAASTAAAATQQAIATGSSPQAAAAVAVSSFAAHRKHHKASSGEDHLMHALHA